MVASQTAMVFGAGGIGTNIAAALCRLGVKKLFIIDFVRRSAPLVLHLS